MRSSPRPRRALPEALIFAAYNGVVCEAAGLYISLNQCSYEPGLGTLPSKRDRLALDEPNAGLPLPT